MWGNFIKSAQGSRVVIVVVHVGTVKIYVAAMVALMGKEKGGQNRMKLSLSPKTMVFFWVPPAPFILMHFFVGFFESHAQGSGAVFSWL
jgi:hypothetical protein